MNMTSVINDVVDDEDVVVVYRNLQWLTMIMTTGIRMTLMMTTTMMMMMLLTLMLTMMRMLLLFKEPEVVENSCDYNDAVDDEDVVVI